MTLCGNRTAGLNCLAAYRADCIACVAFLRAGCFFRIPHFSFVASGRDCLAAADLFVTVCAIRIARITVLRAGCILRILHLSICMVADFLVGQRHFICFDIVSVLGNRQDADNMILRRQNGNTCIDITGCRNLRACCFIRQRIRDEINRRSIYRNAGQRRRAVIFQLARIGHDLCFRQADAMPGLFCKCHTQCNRIDDLIKHIFRLRKACGRCNILITDFREIGSVQRIGKRHFTRKQSRIVIGEIIQIDAAD